ncbi:MAG: GH116 family glycosyl hydrolase, partial [Nitrososphaera sp.]
MSQRGQWDSFVSRADSFLKKTQEHVLQGIDPGGHYRAVWCRDAAYILRDWFMSGNAAAALHQASLIWSHQIQPGREKLVYGRGSPDMKFASETVPTNKEVAFEGALPTTIYQEGYSEVYGHNPDIDSSALMISTTSYMLAQMLQAGRYTASEPGHSSVAEAWMGAIDEPSMIHHLVPKMLAAIDYLASRDVDNDGLLEQDYNEDWMDTALRAGKIVYSQACWILALQDLSALLSITEKNGHAQRMRTMAERAIRAVEDSLWSEKDGCYLDMHHGDGSPGILTQDVAMYLVAVTGHRQNGSASTTAGDPLKTRQELTSERANRALDAIRHRVWKGSRPLVTEVELRRTGPGAFRSNYYHNQTFWPWTTGIEMLARGRLERFEECDMLLAALASETQLYNHAFYEWVDPVTNEGNGAFPFRTGMSAVRIAVSEIL